MIHQFRMNDLNIVMDINSGSIHVVDDIVYDIIEGFEADNTDEIVNKLSKRYDMDNIKEALDEVTQLKENGL